VRAYAHPRSPLEDNVEIKVTGRYTGGVAAAANDVVAAHAPWKRRLEVCDDLAQQGIRAHSLS
jgi:hypothetical protein